MLSGVMYYVSGSTKKNRKIEDGYDYEVMAIILLHKKSFNKL